MCQTLTYSKVVLLKAQFFLILSFHLCKPSKTTTERPANISIKHAKGLLCYQCKSKSSEISPLCDHNYFKLTRAEERINMTFQCPPPRKSFCFMQIETFKGTTTTTRGCYPRTDKENNTLESRCQNSKNKILCFCNENLCNASPNAILNVALLITCFEFIFLFAGV